MSKLALAVAAAALAFVATPALAGHQGHYSSGHSYGHHTQAHYSHQTYGHGHSYQPVHSYSHHKPVHYVYSHGHSYSAPTYVQPTTYASNCYWQVQQYGYEHRKVWVCPQVH